MHAVHYSYGMMHDAVHQHYYMSEVGGSLLILSRMYKSSFGTIFLSSKFLLHTLAHSY
jgi:hypothetical protein